MMLQIKNLSNFILKNISFEVKKGEIFVVMGHNGSGKTTLLKSIVGLAPIDSGKIIFDGENITNLPVFERVKRGIGYIMQQIPDYIGIKVYNYIKGILKDKFDEKEVSKRFFQLGLDRQIYKSRNFDSTLSGGEKKKIEIIVNFLLNRKLYLLDEIETSLDATSVEIIKSWILQMKTDGKSFILVSHIKDLLQIGDRGIILCNGKIDRKGNIEELLDKYLNDCIKCDKHLYF